MQINEYRVMLVKDRVHKYESVQVSSPNIVEDILRTMGADREVTMSKVDEVLSKLSYETLTAVCRGLKHEKVIASTVQTTGNGVARLRKGHDDSVVRQVLSEPNGQSQTEDH